MSHCNSLSSPGTSDSILDGDEMVCPETHKLYRRIVGKLQRLCPIRPDLNYAVKELVRHLSCPTKLHISKLKHLCRYLRGTKEACFRIRPNLLSTLVNKLVEIDVYNQDITND